MRDLPPDLAASLAGGATRLCHCWALTRRDGRAFGFTDHDRDLAFEGHVFAARTGLDAAEVTAERGFAVGGGEVAGALQAAALCEADIAAGLYDGARVETWLVDWSAPAARLLLDVGTLGEIRRAGDAFSAEVRGPMHALDVECGRLYRATCDAELGERRCGVDLVDPRFSTTGTLRAAPEPSALRVGLGRAFPAGWFAGGTLAWTDGPNAGSRADIRGHALDGAEAVLDLWQAPARRPAPGDAFALTAGCDKRFATCRGKFANGANYQGFPHMPGNDFVIRTAPDSGAVLDGGSLFR